MLLMFLWLVQGAIVGWFCSYIAGQKNRSKGNWFVLGFFFSFLAIVALAAIPSVTYIPARVAVPERTKKCPFCAESIKLEAIVCRFCQRDLPEQPAPTEESKRSMSAIPGSPSELTDLQKEAMEKYGIRLSPDGTEFVFQGRSFSHFADAVVLAKSKVKNIT